MSARVSICLPTLNSMEFLAARLDSIRQQTFKSWELVAVDGMSDDGTYQSLLDFAATVPEARVVQAERDGIYPNFNRCIRLAAGEYVYIATSDDTMAADCLEKMVAALDENPDCDLAHCPMRVMDESGGPAPDWWSGHSMFVRSSGPLATRRHKRVAPLDGMLCLLGDNIYSSVTQILIRRSLFDRIGRLGIGGGFPLESPCRPCGLGNPRAGHLGWLAHAPQSSDRRGPAEVPRTPGADRRHDRRCHCRIRKRVRTQRPCCRGEAGRPTA
jgi:glycosyltransferase involved in cell wall biosynthesis